MIPLEYMEMGSLCEVVQLVGRPEQVHRLEELGLRAGATFEMLQPGSPCIIRLAGHRLSIRGSESMGILVRPGVCS